MKTIKMAVITTLIIILMTVGMATISLAQVEKATDYNNGEVVFLLDTSSSMNTQDKNRLAIDAIRQASYSLPSGYHIGAVAYNTGIQTVIPFETETEQWDAELEAIRYNGYTNAGEGLNQALSLFTKDNKIKERYIIMMSDGEIDMPNAAQREDSRSLYTEAAKRAKEMGIKICIIAVGSELNDPKMHIFDGAELTGGAIYWEGQSGSLTEIIVRIMEDRITFPRQELGITDSNGGTVHGTIPDGASRVKIILTGNKDVKEVSADYKAKSGRTIAGKRFAVVDMIRPEPGAVDIRFTTPDIGGVRAYMLTEFTAEPSVLVKYRIEEISRTEEEIKKNIPPVYEHFADITIEIDTVEDITDKTSEANETWINKKLLTEESFEGKEITYYINGSPYTDELEQGTLNRSIPADDIEEIEVWIDTASLTPSIWYLRQPVIAKINKVADPIFEPTPDYRPLWALLGVLAAAIIGLGIWWIKKNQTTVIYVAQPPASGEATKKMETKTCTYSGKFNLYVVRTGDGRDVAPQTYRLFGKSSGRMTLEQILTNCKIKFGKIGASDIIFYPGPDHSVIIMDQSERCTVMRGMEILKKGMGYPIFYNEKITITFEDGETEMEIHYKNLKPSEREA